MESVEIWPIVLKFIFRLSFLLQETSLSFIKSFGKEIYISDRNVCLFGIYTSRGRDLCTFLRLLVFPLSALKIQLGLLNKCFFEIPLMVLYESLRKSIFLHPCQNYFYNMQIQSHISSCFIFFNGSLFPSFCNKTSSLV